MKKLFIVLCLIMVMLWVGGLCAFAYNINHYQTDSSTHTQAIVVLTGGRNRISEAVKLFNDGLADKLFISGVEKNTSLQDISDLQDFPLPENQKQIALENKSTNTIENAIETQAWLRKNNISSIRLVTSNYHMPRSIQEFQYQNPQLNIIPHPVYSNYVAKEWWTKNRSFCLIASEYNKFLYVWLMRRLNIQG